MAPEECHKQASVDRHPILAKGVAGAEVAKVEDIILALLLYRQLAIPFLVEGVMSVVNHHTLQMHAQTVVPDANEIDFFRSLYTC